MMKKSRLILTAVIAVIAVLYPFVCSTALSASYYKIKSGNASRPVKLAFISDLHNCKYGKDMCEIVNSVRSFAPDAVIFGGDLFDDYSETDNSVRLVERLVGQYPCFYAIGNHEGRRDDRNGLIGLVSGLGVNVLRGDHFDLDGNVRIIGIDDILYSDQLESAKNAVRSDKCNVLVYHYPNDFESLCGSGFDLILCGHAHGGQIRIPFIEQGLFAPNQGFFPKYTSGLHSDGSTDMIVSRGLCRELPFAVIPRVFNRPELVFVTIEPSGAD